MPIRFKTDYEYGDIFYLLTDVEQKERMLVSITLSPNGYMLGLDLDGEVTDFYEFQLSKELDTAKKYTSD